MFRPGRQCLYVLREILSVQCLPSWATNLCDTSPQASFGRIYHRMVPLAFLFTTHHLCSCSLRLGHQLTSESLLIQEKVLGCHTAPSPDPLSLRRSCLSWILAELGHLTSAFAFKLRRGAVGVVGSARYQCSPVNSVQKLEHLT